MRQLRQQGLKSPACGEACFRVRTIRPQRAILTSDGWVVASRRERHRRLSSYGHFAPPVSSASAAGPSSNTINSPASFRTSAAIRNRDINKGPERNPIRSILTQIEEKELKDTLQAMLRQFQPSALCNPEPKSAEQRPQVSAHDILRCCTVPRKISSTFE